VHRTIAAPREVLWPTLADPHHLPRWWPAVERVENVTRDNFTEVLRSKRGRAVRADFRVETSRKPELRAWRQEVEGTPFERVLRDSRVEVRLEAEGAGATRVTIEQQARMRGVSRLGGFLVRRATRRLLREALEGLEGLHVG
jgi:carbon monoxide dehydrogenase subunit G